MILANLLIVYALKYGIDSLYIDRTPLLMIVVPSLNKKSLYLTSALLVLFILATYLPLLLKGGIIVDDWGDISQNLSCSGFFECYKSWFPLFSNRPLAPLPITATTLLFTTHFSYYLIFNTFIYFLAIGITFSIIYQIAGWVPALVFAFLASIPMIAMPVIASPINQSTATVAFLYWAFSLQLLFSYCQTKSKVSFCLSYLLLLCGFLTYEVILPLLGLNFLLPFILNTNNPFTHFKKYFIHFVLPILSILFVVILWQKVAAPRIYAIDYSRLAATPDTLIVNFYSWISVFTTQIPALFIKSKVFVTTYDVLTGLLMIAGIFFAFRLPPQADKKRHWKFFFVAAACFMGSSSIFILSGATAESWGYQARALSSTWYSLTILICSLVAITQNTLIKKFLLILIITFGFFSSISFSIQRDGYIESWKLQNQILSDAIELVEKNQVPKYATVIGNLPQFLPKNYNNEIVFSQPWDFGSALAILTKQQVGGGAVIDTRRGDFRNLKFENGSLSIDYWWKVAPTNLWFYDYDSSIHKGNLVKIEGAESLQDHLVTLGYLGNLDGISYIRRGQKISFANDWANREKFITKGWSIRESWGGIWSDGSSAELVLPMPTDRPSTITLNTKAFVSPNHPKQQVYVDVNGTKVQPFLLSSSEENTFAIEIPKELRGLPFITIRFQFPDAASPKSLGIGFDERKLGIGIKSAVFS